MNHYFTGAAPRRGLGGTYSKMEVVDERTECPKGIVASFDHPADRALPLAEWRELEERARTLAHRLNAGGRTRERELRRAS